MALKGHTKIELQDVETGEVEVYEEDNAITPFLQECIDLFSDMGLTMMYEPSPPGGTLLFEGGNTWRNFFGTLCLFPERQDPDTCCKKDNELGWGRYNLVSNIGNTNYQGLYNLEESTVDVTNKTVTMVWDFSTSQAIGTIKSICLAPWYSFSQGNHGNIMDGSYVYGAGMVAFSSNIPTETFATGATVYTDTTNYNTKSVVAMRAGNYMLLSNAYYVTLGFDVRNRERYIISLSNNREIQIHKIKSLQKSLFYSQGVVFPDDIITIKTIPTLAAEDEDVSSLYSTDGDTYTAKAYNGKFMVQGLDMENKTFDIVYELQVNRTGNVTATYYEYNVKTYSIKTGNLVSEYRFLQSNDTIPARWRVANTDTSTTSTYNCITYQFTWRGIMYYASAYNRIKAYDMANDTVLWDKTIPNIFYSYGYDRPDIYPNRYQRICPEFDDHEMIINCDQESRCIRVNLLTGESSSITNCYMRFWDTGFGYNPSNGGSHYTAVSAMPRSLFLDYPHIFGVNYISDNYVGSYDTAGASGFSIQTFLPSRLTTVNNLQTNINKTNKKTMKISYTITEA